MAFLWKNHISTCLISFLTCLTSVKGRNEVCIINTNIKTHNFDNNEFLIIVKGGKIKNLQVIAKINKYLKNNSARSYFYEGLVSSGNGNYYLNWGS